MRRKKKAPPALSAAAVLLCLILVTAHFTAGMYARYVTRTQGSDSGHAAEFNVSATPAEATVVAGKDGYQIELKNTSDVPVSYKAVVQFDDASDAERFGPLPTFTGTLEPGAVKKTEPLVFELTGYDGTGEAPFTVTVTFTQVD